MASSAMGTGTDSPLAHGPASGPASRNDLSAAPSSPEPKRYNGMGIRSGSEGGGLHASNTSRTLQMSPHGSFRSRTSRTGSDVAGMSPPMSPRNRTAPAAATGSPVFRHNRHPFLIGVAGGTASGKTTVCDMIMQRLRDQCVVMLCQDSFYRNLGPQELQRVAAKEWNFDAPDAFDQELMLDCINKIKDGHAVDIPEYDFTTHCRTDQWHRVEPADVVIVEGIMVLHMEKIRELLHMKVYVDTDDDVRLARRIQRDVSVRGRDVGGVIEQYTKFVKPAFDQYIGPSRRYADVIIPWQRGENNLVAIDLITEHIKLKLKQHDLLRIYPNLDVIPSNFQNRGMHTIIRDRTSSKNDFVFYANRMCRIVVEFGLGQLPFKEKTVVTPAGHAYTGVEFTRGICGVSIIRSGEAMENALRECCQGIKIGKILVLRHNPDQQELIYEKLPEDIAERHVLLLDPVLGTGNTACKAIQGVLEHKIVFLCIIAAPEGIHKVCKQYPRLKVITSEIDRGINDEFVVIPGIGEFGDRFFSE